jgi:AcrR family transcriptional regulator
VTRRHGEDPEAVRGRIVQAAHDRFLEEGFHRMTMDELAAELGMSKRTLYRHFRGKIEVLDAVLDLRLASIRS